VHGGIRAVARDAPDREVIRVEHDERNLVALLDLQRRGSAQTPRLEVDGEVEIEMLRRDLPRIGERKDVLQRHIERRRRRMPDGALLRREEEENGDDREKNAATGSHGETVTPASMAAVPVV
jgi:hypothetical protein